MAKLKIKETTVITESQAKDWDSYVAKSCQATFFHLSSWAKVLQDTFGYKPYYLYAEDEQGFCGLLPLFLIRNLFGKKTLSSFPFAIYGGVCSDNQLIAEKLVARAEQIAKDEKTAYLELRNLKPIDNQMLTKDLYVTFIKQLPKDKQACLSSLPRKARAATRKSLDSGLSFEVGKHLLKEFYDIYAISLRNLGSPVFPFRYLENLTNQFADQVTVLSVRYKDKPIASVFTFLFKDTVMPYYGGSLPEYFKYQPNNFMYLKLMEYGVEQGFKYFDFGRSKKGTGSYKFKQLQGFEPQQLYYQYYLNTDKEMPNINPLNPKLSLFIETWKRLPVWMTKLAGAKLSRLTPP